MSGTRSAPRSGFLALAFSVVVAHCLAFMWLYPNLATIPYHVIFISLTVVYGFALWSTRRALGLLALVTVTTGTLLIALAIDGALDWQEASEILLMPAIFLGMLWHSNRQLAARQQVEQLAGRRQTLLDHEHRFMQDASHALRTPITIARGHLDLVAVGLEDEESQQDLAIALEQLDRMSHLSAILVALEEIETAEVDGRETTDISELVGGVFHRCEKTVDRNWHLDAPEAIFAMVDRRKVEMALEAIVENAIKHTPVHGTIRLFVARTPGWVTLGVDDDGPGVPLAERELVFRRFSRGSTATPGQGSGLGLSLVRTVADAHGGLARIEGADLGGAAVTMSFPALAADECPSREPEAVRHV